MLITQPLLGSPPAPLLPWSAFMHMTSDRVLWSTGQTPSPQDKPMPSCSNKLTLVPRLILDGCHHLALTYILTSYPLHLCKPAGPQPSHMIPLPWQLPELSKPLLTEFLPARMPFPLVSSNLTHTLSLVSGIQGRHCLQDAYASPTRESSSTCL